MSAANLFILTNQFSGEARLRQFRYKIYRVLNTLGLDFVTITERKLFLVIKIVMLWVLLGQVNLRLISCHYTKKERVKTRHFCVLIWCSGNLLVFNFYTFISRTRNICKERNSSHESYIEELLSSVLLRRSVGS
jgi:hypothetical protein